MGKTYRKNPMNVNGGSKENSDSRSVKNVMSSEVKNNTNRVSRGDSKRMKNEILRGNTHVVEKVVAKKGTNNKFVFS